MVLVECCVANHYSRAIRTVDSASLPTSAITYHNSPRFCTVGASKSQQVLIVTYYDASHSTRMHRLAFVLSPTHYV